MKALFLLALCTSCAGAQLPKLAAADRVRLGVEVVEQACGVYLSSDEPRQADLDEFCKAIVKPPAVAPDPAPAGGGGP